MAENNFDPKSITILIIDDHDLIRKSIAKVLQKSGFEKFIDCSSGNDAIALIAENSIDLIFCDLYMPKGDGFEVLAHVRNRATNDDIPFIVVTGEAGKDDIVKVIDLGADDYMVKPFQAEELERKTHKALTKYFNPTPLLFHVRKAERFMQENNLEAARRHIDKAVSIDSKSARAAHLRGIILYLSGKVTEAIQTLKNNIQENRNFLKNYISLGDIFLKMKNTPEAIKYMTSEVELNPKNFQRQIQVGQLHHQQGNYTAAIEHFRLALIEYPKAKPALMGMGLAHGDSQNLDKAIYYFKRARRTYPDFTKSLEAIVKYAMELDKPKAAETILRDEKKSFPKRLDTYVVLAKFYVNTERLQEAIAVVDDALRMVPESVQFIQMKGSIQMRIPDFKGAIATFRKLVEIQYAPTTVFLLVSALTEAGEIKEAIKALEQILKVPKTKSTVLANLAVLFGREKDITKAFFIYLLAQKAGQPAEKLAEGIAKLKSIIESRRFRVKAEAELEKEKEKQKDKAS